MALTKSERNWLSMLGLNLRRIAATLEGQEDAVYRVKDAPENLRFIARSLERAGFGQL